MQRAVTPRDTVVLNFAHAFVRAGVCFGLSPGCSAEGPRPGACAGPVPGLALALAWVAFPSLRGRPGFKSSDLAGRGCKASRIADRKRRLLCFRARLVPLWCGRPLLVVRVLAPCAVASAGAGWLQGQLSYPAGFAVGSGLPVWVWVSSGALRCGPLRGFRRARFHLAPCAVAVRR